MISQYFNKVFALLSGKTKPISTGDVYKGSDLTRDFWWLHDRIGALMADITGASAVLLSGGAVTMVDYTHVAIAAGVGYAPFAVTVGVDNASPPTTGSEDVTAVRVAWGAVTGQSLSTATLDGSTPNYVKMKYAEANSLSRTRLKASGSYSFTVAPSNTLTIDDVAPTAYEIALCMLVGDGSTFLTITPYQPALVPGTGEYQLLSSDQPLLANRKFLIEDQVNVTLPASASEGDILTLWAKGRSKILQSDAEHGIAKRGTYFTTTKGPTGSLTFRYGRANLVYLGNSLSRIDPAKTTDPAALPTGTGFGAAWSPDGRYLAIAHDSSPYVTIYDWSTGVPVKIANPATLPPSIGEGAAWSPDGRYLSIAHGSSPYVTIYQFLEAVSKGWEIDMDTPIMFLQ